MKTLMICSTDHTFIHSHAVLPNPHALIFPIKWHIWTFVVLLEYDMVVTHYELLLLYGKDPHEMS